jgi:mRNA-degrading endonuclease toxin of MazEF toxin-antitoxin module
MDYMRCEKCQKEIKNRELVCKECKYQLVKRGDVFLANLEFGTIEVLVIQNNKGNLHSPVTIALPIKNGEVQLDLLRTIDKSRLIKKMKRFTSEQMNNIVMNLRQLVMEPSY